MARLGDQIKETGQGVAKIEENWQRMARLGYRIRGTGHQVGLLRDK